MCLDDFAFAGDGDISIVPVEAELNQLGDQVGGGRVHSLNKEQGLNITQYKNNDCVHKC